MDINVRVTGLSQVFGELRSLAQTVPDNARKIMHRSADRIVKEAKLNAPVDTHALEESIRKEVSYGARGRLIIQVVAGDDQTDSYAVEVHENYASMKPGKGTLAKRDANPGRYIGEKFIDRAVAEEAPKLNRALIAAVMKRIDL